MAFFTWMEYLGILLCWIFLNIRCLFIKKGKRYYSLRELWGGRSWGKKPDGRPYERIGIIAIGLLVLYSFLELHFKL